MEHIIVKLVCPKCKVYWADVKVCFDTVLRPEDIIVKAKYKKKAILQSNQVIHCPKCKYTYTGLDIFKLITMRLKE